MKDPTSDTPEGTNVIPIRASARQPSSKKPRRRLGTQAQALLDQLTQLRDTVHHEQHGIYQVLGVLQCAHESTEDNEAVCHIRMALEVAILRLQEIAERLDETSTRAGHQVGKVTERPSPRRDGTAS